MKIFRFITIVCLVVNLSAIAGEQSAAKSEGDAIYPPDADLKLLEGTWEGADVGATSQQRITITFTGNSLHFYRDKDFWFEATITLPEGTDPKQFHATIKDCSPSQSDSVGEVVGAIFKIEDGTLTVVSYDMTAEPPKTFSSAVNRYVVEKVQPQEKGEEPPISNEPETP